jgi:hypothetical protein
MISTPLSTKYHFFNPPNNITNFNYTPYPHCTTYDDTQTDHIPCRHGTKYPNLRFHLILRSPVFLAHCLYAWEGALDGLMFPVQQGVVMVTSGRGSEA